MRRRMSISDLIGRLCCGVRGNLISLLGPRGWGGVICDGCFVVMPCCRYIAIHISIQGMMCPAFSIGLERERGKVMFSHSPNF